jgi:hypothetical protein
MTPTDRSAPLPVRTTTSRIGRFLAVNATRPIVLGLGAVLFGAAAPARADGQAWRQVVLQGPLPRWIAIDVGAGVYDIGTSSGGRYVTYEFVLRGGNHNAGVGPAVGPSSALLGARHTGVGDDAALRFEQLHDSGAFGISRLGSPDHAIAPNLWDRDVHVVFQSDAVRATTVLFVEGIEVGTAPCAVRMEGPVGLGLSHDPVLGDSEPFAGTLWGVAVYDRALSPTEILARRTAAVAQPQVPPPRRDPRNGHTYSLHPASSSWSLAAESARWMRWDQRVGHLVTVTSLEESEWIRASFTFDRSWLGLFQHTLHPSYSEPAGGWAWYTGEPLAFERWAPGQPDNGGVVGAFNENVGQLLTDGTWDDATETSQGPSLPSLLVEFPNPTLALVNHLPGTWLDISGTGTPLGLGDDDEIDLTMTLGNQLFAPGTIRIGSNGGVRFAGTGRDLHHESEYLPSSRAFGIDSQVLLPLWSDIDTASGTQGEIYWQEVGDTLVVQWERVSFYGFDPSYTATFQLQVHAAGPAFAQLLYLDVSSPAAGLGHSATVGYQAGGRRHDVTWAYHTWQALRNRLVLSLVPVSHYDVGVAYCGPATPGSSGEPAELRAYGSLLAEDGLLRLVATELPPGAFGVFLTSRDAGDVPGARGSVGTLCLGGALGRYVEPGQIGAASDEGVLALVLDLARQPTPNGWVQVVAGETWHFQAWYRDAVGGAAVSNFTQGVRCDFQ